MNKLLERILCVRLTFHGFIDMMLDEVEFENTTITGGYIGVSLTAVAILASFIGLALLGLPIFSAILFVLFATDRYMFIRSHHKVPLVPVCIDDLNDDLPVVRIIGV